MGFIPDMGDKSMFTKGGILIRSPRLKFIIDPDSSGGGGDNQEPKFPANTPVKDMAPEQQAAYWQHHARKHEDRVRAYGDITPEKLAELQQEAEDLRKKNLSDADLAIAQAKEEGRTEVRSVLAAERVKNALDKALDGRVPNTSALLDLDRSVFIDGDKANAEKIAAWVEANSVATEAVAKPFPNLFQGNREPLTTSDRETGKAEAEKRFGSNN